MKGNWETQQLRSQIKKLTTTREQEKQTLLTISSISQTYINLEQEKQDKEREIKNLKGQTLGHQANLNLKSAKINKLKTELTKIQQKAQQLTQALTTETQAREKAQREQQSLITKQQATKKQWQARTWRGKYETEQQEFSTWKRVLEQFLTKYQIESGKLADLGSLIDNLFERDKKVGEFLKQRKDGEKLFNELVEAIKPKTVIFLGKKKTKQILTNLKSVLGYEQVDTQEISDNET